MLFSSELFYFRKSKPRTNQVIKNIYCCHDIDDLEIFQ